MKKLSVIIPMFNVADFVKRCIHSVLDQNLAEDDFEIIIVDDESPDNSLEIATQIVGAMPNVTIISQKNKGLGGARNTGISQAVGDYLLFLDSDDFYYQDTLQVLINKLENSKCDIVEFGAKGVAATGIQKFETSFVDSESFDGVEYYNRFHSMNSACNKAYNREFLLENELFFKERIYIEDYEFNTRVFLKAMKVACIKLCVCCFFINDQSITRSLEPASRLKIREDLVNVMKEISSQLSYYRDARSHHFIYQRLTYLTTTLFYQLVKDRAGFSEFIELRAKLKELQLFNVDYKLRELNKNLFRLMLRNFFLLRIALYGTRYI